MLVLRIVYTYGIGNEYRSAISVPIGSFFPSLKRISVYQKRVRNNKIIKFTAETFLSTIANILTKNIKLAMNYIRSKLSSLKKSTLRKAAECINDYLRRQGDKFPFLPWYLSALDIIENKIFKPPVLKTKRKSPDSIIPIHFHNKGIEFINLSKIISSPQSKLAFPNSLSDKRIKPMVVYNLTSTIRSTIFNYKKFVEELDVDLIGNNLNSIPCKCANSKFINNHHQHIVTGDLRLVKCNKLRKLFTKGPNYRESVTINWNKSRDHIRLGLKEGCESLSSKYDIGIELLDEWMGTVIGLVDSKIETLKKRIKIIPSKQMLRDNDVSSYLKELHNQFVIVPIDKASSNVAFVCKRFYAKILLTEMGLLSEPSDTYKRINNLTIPLCITKHEELLKNTFKIKVDKDFLTLPTAYWIPKMHKTPLGFRFIIASKRCVNKLLSKHVTAMFKLFYEQIKLYHEKVKFFSGIKTFWVIQNNQPVLDGMNKINSKNNAKCISTFDFSTLYTKIPHDKLIDVLNNIIDFCFKGGIRNKIGINYLGSANWIKDKKSCSYTYDKTSIMQAVNYLISQCNFSIGNALLQQIIGIPMGGDPAPFWANLFLFFYESKWLLQMKKTNNILARKFTNTFRFIDDLNALNDGGEFEKHHQEIYPTELILKKENTSFKSATFLDLNINIIAGQFITKLYDKRDSFPFFIVRLPHKSSNSPSKMFYSTIAAEIMRICRATTLFDDFVISVKALVDRMHCQGAVKSSLLCVCHKMLNRHELLFQKYSLRNRDILSSILD